ncbi:hypothetical protein [Pseudonocardia charpentierae]|uniref:Uncharacterized protein n=1 Tax=Pseudonocardia charpentierae TaxID=3075545 RepID=A0ABU2NCD2_9PSEU|nr:hypothetical protein [Pseudonocardia sp. DSM 45834]MDT0351621.1 hypothetical protein [Pseudonocardia sp. DSM 45834]
MTKDEDSTRRKIVARRSPFSGLAKQLQEMQTAPFAGLAKQLRETETALAVGVAKQLREMDSAPFAGLAKQLRETETALAVGVAKQLREMDSAPFAGLAKQLQDMQTGPLTGLAKQLNGMQAAPFAGLAKQLQDMQTAPLAELAKQLHEMDTAPFARLVTELQETQTSNFTEFAGQLRGHSTQLSTLQMPTSDKLVDDVVLPSDVLDLIDRIEPEELLREAELVEASDGEDVDLTQWFRGVLTGVLLYGGPLLVLEVLVISWAIAAEINAESRTKFVELASLVALAIAVAPAFGAMARKVDPGKNKDAQ